MRVRKYLVAIFLSVTLSAPIAFSQSNVRSERFDTYEVAFEDLNVMQRALIWTLGLNWSEIYIKTVFESTNKQLQKVVSVSSWSDYEDEPDISQKDFHMENESDSFLDFITKTKFRKEEAARILELFNYLHNESTAEEKFDTSNLFEKGGGSMHCKLTKEIQEGKNIVRVETFNGKGDKNADIEIIVVKNKEKYIEKISARLKIGIKIILTRRND